MQEQQERVEPYPHVTRLIVPPCILAKPSTGSGRDAILQWLNILEGWLLELQDGGWRWFHVFEATAEMVATGALPTFQDLSSLQRASGASVSVGWLSRSINRFIQDESTCLSKEVETKTIVASNIRAHPADLLKSLETGVKEFSQGLVCLAHDEHCGLVTRCTGLIGLGGEGGDILDLRATIEIRDPDPTTLPTLPIDVVGRYFVFGGPETLVPPKIELSAVVAAGEHAFLRVALRMCDASEKIDVAAGGKMWSSVTETGFATDESSIRKLLRIVGHLAAGRITEIRGFDVRAVRESAAATAPQRVRPADRARGWRLTISTAGVGWRLHYWHIPAVDGRHERYELACVLKKQDPEIIPE